MDEGTRHRLLTLAERMDKLAKMRRQYQDISLPEANGLYVDIVSLAEEIGDALRAHARNGLIAVPVRAG